MGPEVVNKGIVVGGKLVRGLYNDSEEEGEGFDQRFAGMGRIAESLFERAAERRAALV